MHIQRPLQTTARTATRWALSATLCATLIATLTACAGYYRDNEQRTFGEATDDAAIQTVIKTRLVKDPWVDGLQINTGVYKGVVTLEGMVDSREEYKRAIHIARSTNGVRKVIDKLMMNPYATD
jgi:osmotically-inducible protein OsmY